MLQRHVERPLLIGGRKFSLRAFTCTMRGTTFLYDGYFVRLAARHAVSRRGAIMSRRKRRLGTAAVRILDPGCARNRWAETAAV